MNEERCNQWTTLCSVPWGLFKTMLICDRLVEREDSRRCRSPILYQLQVRSELLAPRTNIQINDRIAARIQNRINTRPNDAVEIRRRKRQTVEIRRQLSHRRVLVIKVLEHAVSQTQHACDKKDSPQDNSHPKPSSPNSPRRPQQHPTPHPQPSTSSTHQPSSAQLHTLPRSNQITTLLQGKERTPARAAHGGVGPRVIGTSPWSNQKSRMTCHGNITMSGMPYDSRSAALLARHV